MSFFYNETKAEKPRPAAKKGNRKDIPIASLQAMGCSVCPRDKDKSLRSPKMKPSGVKRSPTIYLLGTSPTREDDEEDMHWTDKAGEVIYSKFGREWMEREVRSNYIMQCKASTERQQDDSTQATECCRRRIVADIEETKPLVIVGIGDAPLRWAVPGLPGSSSTTMVHRGAMFPVKVGAHTCWYFPLMYPNFAFKKGGRKSEYETTLEHDVARIKDFVGDCLAGLAPKPYVYGKPYDEGVEVILGSEPGDMQRLERALQKLALERDSAIDAETSGLRVHMQKDPLLLTVAVGVFEHVVAFPLDHPEGWGNEAQRKRAHALLLEFILASGRKAAHNLSMEFEWLSFFYGNEILRRTEWADTMAMCHTLDERGGTKSLEVQTLRRFGFNLKDQSHIDVRRPKWWLEYPLKDILRYNGMDTKWTDLLRRTLEPEVDAVPAYRYEYDRKVRTASTLVIMENLGLPMDRAYAESMQKDLEGEAESIEAKVRRCPEVKEYSGRYGTFQPTNPDHVLKLMRDVCKREEVSVKDRDGNHERWTTEEEALAAIPVTEVPSASLVLEHRGVLKLLSTYIRPVTTGDIVCVDGLLRSKYGSMVAETGRFNSEDPNIQNWPKRKHKKVRGIIAAPKGEWMVACDYGQIEFRVVGMASQDKNLVKYCWTGYDVHKYWAQRMLKEYGPIKDYIFEAFADALAVAKKKAKAEAHDYDEEGIILKIWRQEAKNGWVFPQLFGSSVRSCAEQLHYPLDVMEELAEEFWDEFRGVKEWQQGLLEGYARHGYVETLDGRRRRGAMTLNQIINHPIQGTALSIVCAAQNALSERAEAEENMECHPRFNGHDDLSFFMRDSRLEHNIPIIVEEMCKHRFDFINVPLLVEVSVGPRWNELEEIKVARSHELFGIPNPYLEA